MSTQMLLWCRIFGSLDRSSVNRQKEKIPPVLHIMHVPAKVWKTLAEKVLICFKFFNCFKYMHPEDNFFADGTIFNWCDDGILDY